MSSSYSSRYIAPRPGAVINIRNRLRDIPVATESYRKWLTGFLLMLALAPVPGLPGQSSITEADGYSCMGVDHSRKETENLALQDAKRNAVEFSKSWIESETRIENFQLKKDLVQAFSKANVRVLDVLNETWDDPATGDCYNIRIQAEVIPAEDSMNEMASTAGMIDDPRAPLTIRIWTNKEEFTDGDTMKIYLKGNKPFYGRLIYVDAEGNNLQLLPNPYRKKNYFQGGVIYEVPTGEDRFSLTVGKPYGREKVILYASTSPLGQLSTTNLGPVLGVKAPVQEIARRTRGITMTAATEEDQRKQVSEFAEAVAEVVTGSRPVD